MFFIYHFFCSFTKCNKCRLESPCVLLRSKDKYCKTCFLAGTVHKFKSLLGKHKLIRPLDKVLVIHKCGHPTSALLHFLRTGLDLETHKKLRFSVMVVFIEGKFHYSYICILIFILLNNTWNKQIMNKISWVKMN